MSKRLELPILKNHDQSKVVGQVLERDGEMWLELKDGCELSLDAFFRFFGNPGVRFEFLDDDRQLVKAFQIGFFDNERPLWRG